MRRTGTLRSRLIAALASLLLVAAVTGCSYGADGPVSMRSDTPHAQAPLMAGSGLEGDPDTGESAASGDAAGESVSSAQAPPSQSTTTSTSTTTTTLPPAHTLTVDAEPVDVELTVVDATGTTASGMSPFTVEVVGPVTVTAPASAGYAALEQTIEVSTDRDAVVWLDDDDQLLHKLAEFDTGRAPKQVAFTPDGTELWVTLLGGPGFEIFDPLTGERLAAVDLPDGGSVEVIFNRAGTLAYISQMETASVYEVDVATREVLRRVSTEGSWTKVMALSSDEETIYASNWVSNDVSEIDLTTGEVTRRLKTVATPRGLYVTPDGERLYVAGFDAGEIQVFDLATGEDEVIYRTGGAMRHLVGDPARGVLYANDMAKAEAYVVDLETDEVTILADTDRTPNTVDVDPEGRVLFVSNRGRNNPETYLKPGPEWGTVVLIDTRTGSYLDAIVGGNQTTGLDVSDDGTLLAYSDFIDDRAVVYRIPDYEVLAAGGGGRWDEHLAELQK